MSAFSSRTGNSERLSMDDKEKWWSPSHLSEEDEVFEEKVPPNEPPSESIEREKIDSMEEETSSVIEEAYTEQEYPAQFEEKGFLGFSWFTKGEAATLLVMVILAFSFIGVGILLIPSEPTYEQNEAVILTSYAGYEIYEAKSCDDYGCDYWTEIECWADFDLYHFVDSVNYTTQLNGWEVYTENYYRDAELDCVSFVENEVFSHGAGIQIYYNIEDPKKAYQYPPLHTGGILLFSGLCCFALLPVVFLYTRFN